MGGMDDEINHGALIDKQRLSDEEIQQLIGTVVTDQFGRQNRVKNAYRTRQGFVLMLYEPVTPEPVA